MGLRGNLTTMSVADLLQFLEVGRKTGLLKIGQGPIVKGIYFETGIITGAITSDPQEALGQFLLHRGKLQESQLARALLRQRQTKDRLGRVLVLEGLLQEQEVLEILRIRNLEAIYDLFLWEKAEFEFHDDILYPDPQLKVHLPPTPLIMEGVYRVDEWRRYRELIPSDRTRVARNPSCPAEEFRKEEGAVKILDLLENPLSVKEIGYRLHASPFFVCTQLFDLIHRGALQVLETPAETQPEKTDTTTAEPSPVKSVPSLLKNIVTLVKKGKAEEAMDVLGLVLQKEPNHTAAQELRTMVESRYIQEIRQSGLSPQAVPRRALSAQEMMRLSLDSGEGFILSRINDHWDVQSIVALSPLREAETLRLLHRLLRKGILRIT
jgi:hypothetical protein